MIGKNYFGTCVAVALLAALLPLSPTAVATSGRPEFGSQFHAMWGYDSDAERIAALDKLAAAGVEWVRIEFSWASLQEQSRNSFTQWYVDRADRMVDAARARGFQVLVELVGTPGWANGGAGGNVPPKDPNDYGRAARFVAEHFRGRVQAWEMWNEPNVSHFFTGTASDYVALVRAAYPMFKAGDPNATVVLAGSAYNDVSWIKQVYAAGAKGYFDVLAVHPYMSKSNLAPETDNGTIWTISAVEDIRAVMELNGDGGKDIWFTEFGWSAHANTGSELNWKLGVTEQQQADFLVRSIDYVQANYPYVTKMFWYNERDTSVGDVHEDNFGLMTRNFKAKPAYTALKERLLGTTYVPAVGENLLSNGGFEDGTLGWDAQSATLDVVQRSYSGGQAGQVSVEGKRDRVTTEGAALPQSPIALEFRGAVKPPYSGHVLRIVIREVSGGSVIGRRQVEFHSEGDEWQRLPVFRYEATGGNSHVSARVKQVGGGMKPFLIDNLRLVRV